MDGKELALRAHGKINLSLCVKGRREDGYHDIESFMQGIGLHDSVILRAGRLAAEESADFSCFIRGVHVDFCIDDSTLPASEDNLALRGVRALLEALPEEAITLKDVVLLVRKKLPVAAGIAGGSGNAAAAMLGVNALLGAPLSLPELMALGAAVGADVPFSLMMNAAENREALQGLQGLSEARTAAHVSGIGERVLAAEPQPYFVLLANPGIEVSTREVYEAMDALPERAATNGGLFFNDMEAYTLKAYEEAAALAEAMRERLHAEHVLMSGSGPTIAAYYREAAQAQQDAETAKEGGWLRENWRIWCTESGGQ